ncbi:hypothetical protein AS156_14270 [Bradyrhizobium macuxiense]|uniref:Uncharacterized protein n=1 Tax=Bradyrhizobium macuxiense TaxID=1755647 RepID=A0A109JK06_9BRAD|nr:hypothetical protein [Bradyrhizobium macuxiense]KWV50487.1 hypothetical protein AS156_14270 [Bradyrhizobium macuxiense]
MVAESRKRIATRIKELQPEASNRQVAKLLGASHQTVNNDVGGKDLPSAAKKQSDTSADELDGGNNSPPPSTSGAAAAKIIDRRDRKSTGKSR